MYIRRVNRAQRVSHEIQRKISVIIQQKINDPRIGDPTISAVQISKDLKNATVFITFIDKENLEEIQSSIMVLQQASSFIRFLLAQSIKLRVVPLLWFKYDTSLIKGVRLCNLISKLHQISCIYKKDVYKCKDT